MNRKTYAAMGFLSLAILAIFVTLATHTTVFASTAPSSQSSPASSTASDVQQEGNFEGQYGSQAGLDTGPSDGGIAELSEVDG
jgi:hypothetical protein